MNTQENKTETVVEKKASIFTKPWVQSISSIVVIALIFSGILVWKSISSVISIEESQIIAPTINLSSSVAGSLDELYVKEGDTVLANTPLARVGSETVSSPVGGVVIAVNASVGQSIAVGQTVIAMINPNDLRVVGRIDEAKGLTDIKDGQPVQFTVDAFGSKKFTGIIDTISPTSNQSGVAFSISDKRETKQFDVSVRFNTDAHPEFKNGMSAKIRIYIK